MSRADETVFPTGDQTSRLDRRTGMTLREYYAGLAMQGMLAKVALFEDDKGEICRAAPEGLSTAAVEFADALLKELAKDGSP